MAPTGAAVITATTARVKVRISGLLLSSGRRGGWVRFPRTRFGRRRFVQQDERGRHALGSDRRIDVHLLLALDVDARDVHDSRELAYPVEEDRQVVVSPVEFELNWPLGVQRLGDGGRRLERLDFQL